MNKKELIEYLSKKPVGFITDHETINDRVIDFIYEELFSNNEEYAKSLVDFITSHYSEKPGTNISHYKNIKKISILNNVGINYDGEIIECYDENFNGNCSKCIFKKSGNDCILNYPAEFYEWANQEYKPGHKIDPKFLVFVSNDVINWVVRLFEYEKDGKYYAKNVKTNKISAYKFCKPYVTEIEEFK